MKIFLTVFAIGITLALLTQSDDELSSDAESLIYNTEDTYESDAYLFLMGFYANDNDNPISVGKRILGEHHKFESDSSYEVVEYNDLDKITIPEGALFCASWEDGCLSTLFNTEFTISDIQNDHITLISRLNRFHEFKEFKTLNKPSFSGPFPPYQYINAAERIKVLLAITLHKRGLSSNAMLALDNQLSLLRRSLALQDSLIGKMIFLMKISEVLDTLSIISAESKLPVKEVRGLTLKEKDFSIIAAREFSMSHSNFQLLDRNPEFFEMGGNLPGWIVRILYKPNMTSNAIAPIFSRFQRLPLLTPNQFMSAVESHTKIEVSTNKIRNFVGSLLIREYPDYDVYVARLIDIEAKIVLFNQLNNGLKLAVNPYYSGETPTMYEDKACFKGPLEDKRFLRCLRIRK